MEVWLMRQTRSKCRHGGSLCNYGHVYKNIAGYKFKFYKTAWRVTEVEVLIMLVRVFMTHHALVELQMVV